MDKKAAVAACQQLAGQMGVTLGRHFYYRVFRDNLNNANWAMLFTAPDCPPGWEWLAIVNDRAEEGVLAAIKRNR
jgi:hypothetical protein